MLEEVGVQFLIRQGQVRFHVIGKFHYLQVYSLFGKLGFHKVQQLRMRNRGSANFNHHFFGFTASRGRFFLRTAATAKEQ